MSSYNFKACDVNRTNFVSWGHSSCSYRVYHSSRKQYAIVGAINILHIYLEGGFYEWSFYTQAVILVEINVNNSIYFIWLSWILS